MAQLASDAKPAPPKRQYHGCSARSKYETMDKLGEGTFGEVWRAMSKKDSKVYALKKILMHNEKDGFPITALREINLLKSLSHPNVLRLEEMAIERDKNGPRKRAVLFMVTPYMDHDLSGLLDNPHVNLTESHIKCYMLQLLQGLKYLHNSHILHRDMKAANLLINNHGILQIADFGLARHYDEPVPQRGKGSGEAQREYTSLVVTRWYRPPELLLSLRRYTPAIDMWGAGCVFGEMFKRKPILTGATDIGQANLIFDLVGYPSEQTMPGWTELPNYHMVKDWPPRAGNLEQLFREQGSSAISLLRELLKLDWRRRITAVDALEHPYFKNDPKPAKPGEIPTFPASHELDRRHARGQQAAPPPAPAGGDVGMGPNVEWTGSGPPPTWENGPRHRGYRDPDRPIRHSHSQSRRDYYDGGRDARGSRLQPPPGDGSRHPLPLPPHRRPDGRERFHGGTIGHNADTYIPSYGDGGLGQRSRDRDLDEPPRDRDRDRDRDFYDDWPPRPRGSYRDPDAPPPDRRDRPRRQTRSRSPEARERDRDRMREKDKDPYRDR